MSALQLRDIRKSYGKLVAIAGLNMVVEEGQVYGFLGRNGAGKSTALRIIMGVTRANSGAVSIFGNTVRNNDPEPRKSIGYVAQEQHFYEWMTANSIGKFVSAFYPTWDDTEYQRILRLLEVPSGQKIQTFSGGMRAKLALSLALAHNPRLLLLDEPTAGMDAVARREFIDIVRDHTVRAHRTTLFSSHLIDEVERAADTVGIINQGLMCYEGSLETLRHSIRRYVVECGDDADFDLPLDVTSNGATILQDRRSKTHRSVTVRFHEPAIPGNYDLTIAPWRAEQPSLEDIFVDMVSETVRL